MTRCELSQRRLSRPTEYHWANGLSQGKKPERSRGQAPTTVAGASAVVQCRALSAPYSVDRSELRDRRLHKRFGGILSTRAGKFSALSLSLLLGETQERGHSKYGAQTSRLQGEALIDEVRLYFLDRRLKDCRIIPPRPGLTLALRIRKLGFHAISCSSQRQSPKGPSRIG
jgi:hypothetical protein